MSEKNNLLKEILIGLGITFGGLCLICIFAKSGTSTFSDKRFNEYTPPIDSNSSKTKN